MDEKTIESTARNLVDSMEKKDIEKSLSYFTEDAVYYTPVGIFKGKDVIRRYFAWMAESFSELKFTDEGVGIIIKDNISAHQSTYSAKYDGIAINVRNICTAEFKGNKIKNHWTLTDRLSLAEQATKNPIARKVINSIIAQSEKGLH